MKKKLVSGEREEGPATASGMEVKQRDGSDAGKTDRDGKIAQRRPNVEGGENGGAISVTGGKEKKRKKICDAKPGQKRTKGPQSFFSFFCPVSFWADVWRGNGADGRKDKSVFLL